MANRAGLKKVTKTVRGKHGSVRRSYWVRGTEAVKGAAKKVGAFVSRHKGKIAAGAAIAGTAAGLALAHRRGLLTREAAGKAASAVRSAAGRAASAPGRAWAAHKRGVEKATSQRKAAAHPDRVVQGHDTGRWTQLKAAVRGYAKGSGMSEAASKAADSVRGAAGRAASSARSAASSARAAGSRVSRAASDTVTRARGRSTSRELVLRR